MKIEIYTRDDCGYCIEAKKLLNRKQILFAEYKIPDTISREEVKEKFPDAKTVPIIVIDNEWIGGYNELQQIIGGE